MHDIGEAETDHGHRQDGEVMPERRNFPEQRIADDFDEIEQKVVLDDELAIAGNLAIVPEYGRHEKGKLHQVAYEKLDITEPRADEAENHHDPEAVDEQQDDAEERERSRGGQGDQCKHDAHEVEDDMVAEGDQRLEHRTPDIEIDAERRV